MWVEGADRNRNPDEDLPPISRPGTKINIALAVPREADAFIARVRLAAFKSEIGQLAGDSAALHGERGGAAHRLHRRFRTVTRLDNSSPPSCLWRP